MATRELQVGLLYLIKCASNINGTWNKLACFLKTIQGHFNALDSEGCGKEVSKQTHSFITGRTLDIANNHSIRRR